MHLMPHHVSSWGSKAGHLCCWLPCNRKWCNWNCWFSEDGWVGEGVPGERGCGNCLPQMALLKGRGNIRLQHTTHLYSHTANFILFKHTAKKQNKDFMWIWMTQVDNHVDAFQNNQNKDRQTKDEVFFSDNRWIQMRGPQIRHYNWTVATLSIQTKTMLTYHANTRQTTTLPVFSDWSICAIVIKCLLISSYKKRQT